MDKGLLLRGINRSALADYQDALEAMRDERVQQYLFSLLSSRGRQTTTASEILEACRYADRPDRDGKVFLDLFGTGPGSGVRGPGG